MAVSLKVGGKYRTRDGRVAEIQAVTDDPPGTSYAFVGFIDGIRHSWKGNGSWYFFESNADLVEEVQGLKLEAGKYYRTDCGEKAYVHYVLPPHENVYRPDWPAAGYIGDARVAFMWTIDGKYFGNSFHHHNLVAEWKDPPRSRPVYLYEAPNGTVIGTGNEYADYKLLAKSTITEGQGL